MVYYGAFRLKNQILWGETLNYEILLKINPCRTALSRHLVSMCIGQENWKTKWSVRSSQKSNHERAKHDKVTCTDGLRCPSSNWIWFACASKPGEQLETNTPLANCLSPSWKIHNRRGTQDKWQGEGLQTTLWQESAGNKVGLQFD